MKAIPYRLGPRVVNPTKPQTLEINSLINFPLLCIVNTDKNDC